MAAVHARVGELERQKAALQAELAPLLARHEALASKLPLRPAAGARRREEAV